MLCPNCKYDNADTAKFCSECGARLTATTPSPRTDIAGPVTAPILSGQFTGPVTINPPAETPSTDWRALYLRQLFNACNFLPLQALAPGLRASGQRLNLAALYTPLLTLTPEEHDQWARGERAVDARARRLSALDQLSRHKRLLLLGDPGFGKSTFVNFVALCLSGQALGEEHINLQLLTAPVPAARKKDEKPEPQEWQPGALLPVRVILREFAQALLAHGSGADTLWQFIAGQLSAQSLGEGAAPLKAELQNRGGLILLDGLDEVPEANRRRAQLIAIVEAFANAFGKCRVLVTGRTYAYRAQDWQLGEFQVAVLSPFNLPQIEAFAGGWYTQLAARHKLPAAPEVLAQSLLTRVRERPRLRDLAQQPLLLTFMAGLHIFSPLPERRQELYEKIVELLLSEWEQGKFTAPEETAPGAPAGVPSLVQVLKVSLTDLREALEKLAFDAHQTQPAEAAHRTADLTEDQLVAALYKIKGLAGEHGDPDTLKAHLKERAGLLIEHGVDRYTFPHRTLQEYLAACHLAHLTNPKTIAELARDDPDRWREVALLAGAKLAASQYTLWALVSKLCLHPATPAGPAADVWGAHLAGQLLAEAAHLENLEADDAQTLERVTKSLAQGVLPGSLNATERALAGRHLAQLGDPRPEVLTAAQMEFCRVPPGPFVMGEEEDQHRNKTLAHGYWLARCPVTNAQFAEFAQAGGYADKRYWPEAEAAGWWRDGQFKGRYDNEPRTGPVKFGDPFPLLNHPVVGVSWYEALAFCRWLSEQCGVPVALPTEAEWEKAARGGEQILTAPLIVRLADGLTNPTAGGLRANPAPERAYPWEGDFDSNKANTAETQVGATSAVGCFPLGASPYGCLEMSGNVWEWCQSKYKPYPYKPDDGREVIDQSNDDRVVRGGSWGDGQVNARAAVRDFGHPGGRGNYWGFRVCVRPPSLLSR